MKRLIYIIALILAFGATIPASAVTDKEMEQARTIAAQTYLRYANNGSGYLDDLHPKTMAELEKSLKAKEKENIKAFKAIPVPKDYASWDKAKLVEYWGAKVFSSKGLLEKGREGKSRATKKLNAMTVSAAKPEAPATSEPKAATPEAKPEPTKVEEQKTVDNPAAAPATAEAPADSANVASQDPLAAEMAIIAEEQEEEIKKAENHTWVYVIILIILVGVVVALVVFASNVMKRNNANLAARRSPDLAGIPDTADSKELREKFAASLKEKDDEIRSLNKKVEELSRHNASLKSNLEALTAETASLRNRLSEATRNLSSVQSQGQPARPVSRPEPRKESPAPAPVQPARPQQPKGAGQASPLRTIYLGRANAKGIFVRADRSLNVGNSIYRLDTSDGYAGTFRVVNDPTVWEMALLTPRESLSGACVAPELENTEGMERIVNDSSGTAIFEGGCWKVIRKAKIHYE